MKKYNLLFFFVISLLVIPNLVFAENLKFANIDLIIKNTNVGKKALTKINKLDQENMKKLNSFEKEMKEKEN